MPFNLETEAKRLDALQALEIMGTPPEPHYDAVCRIAQAQFGVPTVLISLVGKDRQWFKAKCGFDAEETSRDVSFCARAILSDEPLIVEDTAKSVLFAANPLVTGAPYIRFYAGAPLILGPGIRAGTICLIDYKPRAFGPAEIRQLQDLASIVIAHLRLQEALVTKQQEIERNEKREAQLQAQAVALHESNRLLNLAEDLAGIGHWRLELPDHRRIWSKQVYQIFGADLASPEPDLSDLSNGYHPEDRARVLQIIAESMEAKRDFAFEARVVQPSGSVRDIEVRACHQSASAEMPEAFFGVVIDLTKFKRAQADLVETQSRFDFLASSAKDYALYMLDTAGCVTNWNKGAEGIKGYSADEILGQHFSIFYTPDDRAAGVPGEALARASAGEHFEAEGWQVRRDGSRFLAHVLIDAIRDSDDRLTGYAKITRDVTAQREAESKISVSRARYRLLAENSTDMIVQIALDGTRVFVSPGCEDLLGYKPEELAGTKPSDSIHPEDAGRFEAMVASLLHEGRKQASVVNRIRHKNGSYVWVEARWRVMHDSTGAATGFVASVRDVTSRRDAEEALRQSEALYRTLADGLPQQVGILKAGSRELTYANKTLRDFYGFHVAGVDTRVARLHPDDRPPMGKAWTLAEKNPRTFEIEARLLRSDDVYRWHKMIFHPLFRDGTLVEWVGTALDIDEIVAAGQKLKETTELLSLSQEAAGAGVFDINLITNRTLISRESAWLHGFSGDEPVELSFAEWEACVHPGDGPRCLQKVAEACAAHTTYSEEFRIVKGHAAGRWIHGMGRAHYDAEGKAIRIMGLNFDVTERKAAEALLIEARAAAERASEAKTDFLASMSHEIRTPLNSILGYADLLLEQTHHRPADRRKLDLIRHSGAALLTVVNDILDFSKIEAGQIDLDLADFRVDALAGNVISILSVAAAQKGLWLHYSIAPDVPLSLVGDGNRLQQILLNLLNNAIKFTPAGDISFDVVKTAEAAAGAGARIRFTVRDTGIGIPLDLQSGLFQRFSQGDSSITRRFGGTGLGLAISKRIVDLMGGEIGFESLEGRGATFWFEVTLPFAAEPVRLAVLPETGAPSQGRAARILLVEDVEINRELAVAVLSSSHEVDIATNGLEAIEMVQRKTYDIVLMDVQMPDMDGLTATRRIRALDHVARKLPIVAMTANVLPQQIAAFKASGMDDHIGKPFKRAELYRVIERWVPAVPAALAAICDETVLREISGMVGETAFDGLLTRFLRDLDGRFFMPLATLDSGILAEHAHAMAASAGLLGFLRFSKLCVEIERAARKGDAAHLIPQLEEAGGDVRNEIFRRLPGLADAREGAAV